MMVPASMSVTMLLIISIAFCNHLLSVPHTDTLPSSEMSILTPVLLDNLIDYLTLLADNIADLLRIDGDLLDLRAYLPTSVRGSAIAFAITSSRM